MSIIPDLSFLAGVSQEQLVCSSYRKNFNGNQNVPSVTFHFQIESNTHLFFMALSDARIEHP